MDTLSLYYKFFEFEYLYKFLMYCYKDFCDILLSVFPMLPKALAMCLWQQNFQRHWETFTKTHNCTENFILVKNKGVKPSRKEAGWKLEQRKPAREVCFWVNTAGVFRSLYFMADL